MTRYRATVCRECGRQLPSGWEQHQVFPTDGPGVTHRGVEVVELVLLRDAVKALESLRAAWNAHMATCPQHASVPSFDEIRAWMDAPSNTASASGDAA